jgi:hypothetical protein
MEHLIYNLRGKLVLRKEEECNNMKKLDTETDKDIILISSGKLIELEFLINAMDEMLNYYNQTKRIAK